jgi:hypothetical protein
MGLNETAPAGTPPPWTVHCDGSATPNPGRMGVGAVITAPDGTPPRPARPPLDRPAQPAPRAAVFEHDVGIRFNGKEREDVEEYCISEGWIKVPAGKTVDRKGQPLMIKLKGKVEAFYK